MKKFKIAVIVTALLLAACGNGGNKKVFTSLADFDGAKVASLSGAVFAQYLDPVIPNIDHKYYNTLADMAIALSANKIDAVSLDMPVGKYLVAQNPNLVLFPEVVADDRYGFAVAKNSELAVKANDVLQKLKDDGTLAELEKLWLSSDESAKKLPELTYKSDFDGTAGTIRYACETTYVPTSYIGADGKPIGFEIDVVSRIAYELNMNLEVIPMAFSGLLAALESGKADMVGGCMSITEERLKSVDFVGPNYEGGIVLIVKKDRMGK
jgi:polar amino acid transport system substrate-binding protein